MNHKEETLVCPSVKYADQISKCKQIHCKDCQQQSEKQNGKIDALEKKLKTMSIIGAVAVTVVGKDLVDKILASFDKVQEVQQKVEDAASPASSSGSGGGSPPKEATTRMFPGVQKPFWGKQYPMQIKGDRSAYVTELDTPFAMDPSSPIQASGGYSEIKFVFSTPKQVVADSYIGTIPLKEEQGTPLMTMNEFALASSVQYSDYSPITYTSNSPFGGYDYSESGSNFSSFAVPAPSAFALLALAALSRRRAR